MNTNETAATQVKEALKEFFDQVRFARAVELAHARRYLEAEGLLSPNGREPTEPKELDLLARIAAQQGQYERSRRLWETALQQSPNDPAYKRAIERTREAECFRAKLQKVAMVATLMLAVLVSFFVGRNFFLKHPVSPPTPPSAQKGK